MKLNYGKSEVRVKPGRKKREAPGEELKFLAEKVKGLRTQSQISQEKLGELSGTTSSYICRIEQGKVSPSFLTMVRIAEALGAELDEFQLP